MPFLKKVAPLLKKGATFD